jgi:hypothetical protein
VHVPLERLQHLGGQLLGQQITSNKFERFRAGSAHPHPRLEFNVAVVSIHPVFAFGIVTDTDHASLVNPHSGRCHGTTNNIGNDLRFHSVEQGNCAIGCPQVNSVVNRRSRHNVSPC